MLLAHADLISSERAGLEDVSDISAMLLRVLGTKPTSASPRAAEDRGDATVTRHPSKR